MPENEVIAAKDCLPFPADIDAGLIPHFIAEQSGNVFWFSAYMEDDEPVELATYDYWNNRWSAGRYIGEAIIDYQGQRY